MRRLKRRSEFLRVAGTRRKFVTPGLILQIRPQEADDAGAGADDSLRVGFTVSRRVGNAVQRNRARRRLKAAVGQVFPSHAAKGNDFVVIGRGATVGRPFSALMDDLTKALRRLDAYRDAA